MSKFPKIISIFLFILSASLNVGSFADVEFNESIFSGFNSKNPDIAADILSSGGFYNPAIIPLDSDLFLYIFAFGTISRLDIGGYSVAVPHYCISRNLTCNPKPLQLYPHMEDYRFLKESLRNFEDTRAMYAPSGDIVLAISCPSQYTQRSSCFISAQVVIPELQQYLMGIDALYPNLVEIRFKGFHSWIKNQVPIFNSNGSSTFMYNISPNMLYKTDPNGLSELVVDEPNNCATDLLEIFKYSNGIHIGSNPLRLVLCKKGECTPSNLNTIIVLVTHIRYNQRYTYSKYPYYFRFFHARNATYPYKPLFFSNAFVIKGFNPFYLIYSETINYIYSSNRSVDKDLGYLDTPVVLGSGIDHGEYRAPLQGVFTFENKLKPIVQCSEN